MIEQTIHTVGLIGLGRIGLPIARHVAAAGIEVAVHDREPAAIDPAKANGFWTAASAADVAGASDLVIVVVGFESQVEWTMFGPDGMATYLRSGTILAIASTVAPSYMAGLSDRLSNSSVRLVDIPLSRGEKAAEEGRLLVYSGCAEPDVDACRSVLVSLAEYVFRLGGVGAGQVAKAVNTMLLWACLCANVEALRFAERFGIDSEALREMLSNGSRANWALTTRADERLGLWAEKGMTIVLSETDTMRIAMPVAATVKEAAKAFKIVRGLPKRSAHRNGVLVAGEPCW